MNFTNTCPRPAIVCCTFLIASCSTQRNRTGVGADRPDTESRYSRQQEATIAAVNYKLSVDNFYGVEGFTLHYDITPEQTVVTYTDDFGNPTKELWKGRLSQEQREMVARCLRSIPIGQLKELYEDPSVDDGLQLTFRIKLGDEPERTFAVQNEFQEDLFRIIDLINSLVPEKHRIAFDQGKVIAGSE